MTLPPRNKPKPGWTTGEIRILREHYPVGGANACAPLLPKRTKQGIRIRAALLEIYFEPYLGRKRRTK